MSALWAELKRYHSAYDDGELPINPPSLSELCEEDQTVRRKSWRRAFYQCYVEKAIQRGFEAASVRLDKGQKSSFTKKTLLELRLSICKSSNPKPIHELAYGIVIRLAEEDHYNDDSIFDFDDPTVSETPIHDSGLVDSGPQEKSTKKPPPIQCYDDEQCKDKINDIWEQIESSFRSTSKRVHLAKQYFIFCRIPDGKNSLNPDNKTLNEGLENQGFATWLQKELVGNSKLDANQLKQIRENSNSPYLVSNNLGSLKKKVRIIVWEVVKGKEWQ